MGVSLKEKEFITITYAFHKISDKSNNNPKKIWVDRDSVYNRLMKSWLQDNDTKLYSAHNEGKSDLAEKFIKTLKNKIHEYMISISKNVYIDKLDNIVDE